MLNAIVDRIIDDKYLVLLVGTEEKEYIVSVTGLSNRLKEGDWVTVQIDESDKIIDIQLNESETKKRQDSIQDKMALLRARRGSNFKNN